MKKVKKDITREVAEEFIRAAITEEQDKVGEDLAPDYEEVMKAQEILESLIVAVAGEQTCALDVDEWGHFTDKAYNVEETAVQHRYMTLKNKLTVIIEYIGTYEGVVYNDWAITIEEAYDYNNHYPSYRNKTCMELIGKL